MDADFAEMAYLGWLDRAERVGPVVSYPLARLAVAIFEGDDAELDACEAECILPGDPHMPWEAGRE